MEPCHRSRLAKTLIRWLMPAVMLVFGSGWRGEAAASPIASAPAFDAEEHDHHCRCSTRCRGASCC